MEVHEVLYSLFARSCAQICYDCIQDKTNTLNLSKAFRAEGDHRDYFTLQGPEGLSDLFKIMWRMSGYSRFQRVQAHYSTACIRTMYYNSSNGYQSHHFLHTYSGPVVF